MLIIISRNVDDKLNMSPVPVLLVISELRFLKLYNIFFIFSPGEILQSRTTTNHGAGREEWYFELIISSPASVLSCQYGNIWEITEMTSPVVPGQGNVADNY